MVKKYILYFVVLISGASSMVFEIVAPRLFAPYFGTSTYVWTSVIGVVLTGLSVGYYLGGILAHKKSIENILVGIYLISSILALIVWIIKDFILGFIFTGSLGNITSSLLASVVLLLPINLFIGMITPLTVEIIAKDGTPPGSIAGNIYSISTIGSIAGTFLAGLFLIPRYGTSTILFGVSVSLLLCSIVVATSGRKRGFLLSLAIFYFVIFLYNNQKLSFIGYYQKLFNVKVVDDINTSYDRIWIFDRKINNSLTVRVLANSQSTIFLDKPISQTMENDLSYYSIFNLAPYYNKNLKTVLMIGGGAYTQASYFLNNYPNLQIDVVEIDSKLLEISKKYFSFSPTEKFKNYNLDGRVYLNNNQKKYDAIFLDAYRNGDAIPFHLSTKEAYKLFYDSLNEDGLLFVNIISSIDGKRSLLFKSQFKTISSIFNNVYVFPVESKDTSYNQNIVLLAQKGMSDLTKISFSESEKKLTNLSQKYVNVKKYIRDGVILTDDYSPVEYFDLGGVL